MDHNYQGPASLTVMVISIILTFTLQHVQGIAACIACVSGLFAIRYYILATKNLKK